MSLRYYHSAMNLAPGYSTACNWIQFAIQLSIGGETAITIFSIDPTFRQSTIKPTIVSVIDLVISVHLSTGSFQALLLAHHYPPPSSLVPIQPFSRPWSRTMNISEHVDLNFKHQHFPVFKQRNIFRHSSQSAPARTPATLNMFYENFTPKVSKQRTSNKWS